MPGPKHRYVLYWALALVAVVVVVVVVVGTRNAWWTNQLTADQVCVRDNIVLHKLQWKEFWLKPSSPGSRAVFVSAYRSTKQAPFSVELENSELYPTVPDIEGGPYDESGGGSNLSGTSQWIRKVVRFFEQNPEWPQNTVVVVVNGSYLHSEWNLSTTTVRPQGVLVYGCTWYSRENVERFVRSGTNTVWPLALPDPAFVPVPASVRRAGPAGAPPIHQTWKSWELLSERSLNNVRRISTANSATHQHWFWPDVACTELLQHNFDHRIGHLYRQLIPGAYKADVWRLCALYAFGGVYLDIDMDISLPLCEFVNPGHAVQLCRDLPHSTDLVLKTGSGTPVRDFYLYNAIISVAFPGHPFMRTALLRTMSHIWSLLVLPDLMITDPLYVTGPACLGLAWLDFAKLPMDMSAVAIEVSTKLDRKGRGHLITTTGHNGMPPGLVVGTTKSRAGKCAGDFGSYVTDFRKGCWFDRAETGESTFGFDALFHHA